MEKRFEFQGTGGGLFVKYLVGILLSMITLGIYASWFVCSLMRYLYENTTFHGAKKGDLKLEFTGSGGQLFVLNLVGYLLTLLTLGIYYSWWFAKMMRFVADNSVARASDGTAYRLRFNGTGGEFFVTFFVGGLLTMITFGIYAPWFLCKLQHRLLANTEIFEGDEKIVMLSFTGTGGRLFVTNLVGMLLTMITFGIYGAWFQVKLFRFFAENTRANAQGEIHFGRFDGTGGQLFVTCLVGGLLTMITFGIYGAWFLCKLIKFQTNNTVYAPQR